MDQPPVPYRSMPMGYLAVWIGLNLVIFGLRHVQDYGWPPVATLEQIVQIVGSSILSGWLWGWVFWRFWLYKRFPESSK